MSSNLELNELEKEVILSDSDENIRLMGILAIPPKIKGMVVFAHGSGSGRFSPRNNYVARILQEVGLGTLLLDLLTEEESLDRANVFDIELLADRLKLAKDWLANRSETSNTKVGYFGASTGAGAALMAAAKDPNNIYAVVSRGGRPDLAGDFLKNVKAATLLIIGGCDDIVIELNRQAFELLDCRKEIKIVPGATHLFEEPGTLEEVAELASEWFVKWA